MRPIAVATLFACLTVSLTLLMAQAPQTATKAPGTIAPDLGAGAAFSPISYGASGDCVANDRAEQQNAMAAGRRFDTIPLHPIDVAWLRTRVHSPSNDASKW